MLVAKTLVVQRAAVVMVVMLESVVTLAAVTDAVGLTALMSVAS